MTLSARLVLSVLLTVGLYACATDETPAPPQRHHHHRGGEGGPGSDPGVARETPMRGGLFISPSGKPFRAGPGEAYPSAVWFAAADANHDGRLNRTELRADATAFFHELDINGDGVIDAAEIAAYERAVPEIVRGFQPAQGGGAGGPGAGGGGGRHGGGHHGGGGGGRGGGMGSSGHGAGSSARAADAKPQGAAWFSFLSIPEPVASSDRNLDGHITLDEFLAAADSRFDLLDDAKQNYLTLDTLPKTPVQQMGRGRGDRP